MNINFSGAQKHQKDFLNHVAFPMGGIGAGTICMEGSGGFSHVSLKNRPDIFNAPTLFSAISIKKVKSKEPQLSLVMEGPVLKRKIFGNPASGLGECSCGRICSLGLPRFNEAIFRQKFPFCEVSLKDKRIPMKISILGWSPFIPLDADNSSLPIAGLEYRFKNTSNKKIEAVYSFNAHNFLAVENGNSSVKKIHGGLILDEQGTATKPWDSGALWIYTDDKNTVVNPAWFRGGWFDPISMLWNQIRNGEFKSAPEIKDAPPSPGGSIFIPIELMPKEEKTIRVMLAWYYPESQERYGREPGSEPVDYSNRANLHNEDRYIPWYAKKFTNINKLADYWKKNYDDLKENSILFSNTLYKSSLPSGVIDAVASNLSILKSPTILRQTDGRLWGWEGCNDITGSCFGSCTHVWNYAQSIPHLFPNLERSLRQTEFNESQDENGHQMFRSALPIRPLEHDQHAAADGQLGGIMKIYRDWRISGDTSWLMDLWPKVKASLQYCIATWDPQHKGILSEPHHNTYDIEFWGPDGMCCSFYLGALKAAKIMAEVLNDDFDLYEKLYRKGRKYLENTLFNGEYFEQKIQWKNLNAGDPSKFKPLAGDVYSKETMAILKKEGPKYQYGKGCLSDGVLGAWMAEVCGLGEIIDRVKIKKHLLSVYKYNFIKDISCHANPQRPFYAIGHEGGLLLCTWPKGNQPSLPFPYSSEVWTGIEYQVASHLMMLGCAKEGLDIIRAARKRFDGQTRNPFDEYECGHWYARAMSSYALLQGATGIRYDAIDKTLYINNSAKQDFQAFICTATGYGLAGIKNGKPFLRTAAGKINRPRFILT